MQSWLKSLMSSGELTELPEELTNATRPSKA